MIYKFDVLVGNSKFNEIYKFAMLIDNLKFNEICDIMIYKFDMLVDNLKFNEICDLLTNDPSVDRISRHNFLRLCEILVMTLMFLNL